MKKGIILLVVALAVSFGTSAQIFDKNALGLKFGGATGDYSGAGTLISYQRGINDINRLEFNLYFNFGKNYSIFAVEGFHQWVWNINGGFNWYAGPGASIGLASIKNGGTESLLGVGGIIGIEYRFANAPIQIALDVTPILGLTNGQGLHSNCGLGIRYCF